MTLSGGVKALKGHNHVTVLIPLLVDDPLWVVQLTLCYSQHYLVLIPLLVDDPLWVVH